MSIFSNHPASVGETYFQHLRTGLGFGIAMLAGGLACLVHALIPSLFEKTGSKTIARLHSRMIVNRSGALNGKRH